MMSTDPVSRRLCYLLFGDQSLDTYAFLAELCRKEEKGILAKAFLNQVAEALRIEVEQLSALQREKLPVFRTLQQLNENYRAQKIKHPGLDGALLCVSQLAHYLDHVESHPEDISPPDSTFLVGLCTGMFAAAAIASTASLSALVPVGVKAVLMAFRTGSYVAEMADRIYASGDVSESWTYVVPTKDVAETERLIAQFNKTSGLPPASQAYISAAATSSIAVSGPPSTLKALISGGGLDTVTSIPVHGPYHAAHLHKSADIRKILRLDEEAMRDALSSTKSRSAIMSCSTGTWIPTMDTASLFERIVNDILSESLRFNKVLEGCLEVARGWSGFECLILPVGPTQNASTLLNLLKAQTDMAVELRSPPAPAHASASRIGNHGSSGRCKLAIVGMAGRFPDAASHEKLWELLAKGLDVHRVVPADRFNVQTHYDPTGKKINSSHTPYGCWIEGPGLFDPRFFNMSPREAFQTDPMQRMALTTAYEALEMSGYVPNRTPSTRLDRIGTFYGQTSDDWREINAAQEVDTYFITGGVRAFGPGRINYHFGFSGPSLNIDTACSSSAAAMNVAAASLWAHDCDTAIVGGLSCMTNPDIFSGLSRGQFLSKKGPCATFDNAADGYCRGDGCASVIIKRLDDAISDRDNILAVILGTQTNHSADAISITHPHGPTQSILSRSILDDAGIDPLDVDYVEMHGTGTQAGDGTEMKSVTSVFAPADRKRPADRPLYLGAIKANVGHGEAASGVTALIKVLLMLKKNAIPPHVGIKKGSEINKTFPKDLSERNVNIAFHMTPFIRKDGKPRRVFVNNFSAAGGNTGLLIEDGPVVPAAMPDPRSYHVLSMTGKSKSAMIRNAQRLVAYMDANPNTPLCDVAYTTTARRIQHYWRMNVAVQSIADAKQAIEDRLKQNFVPVSPEPPTVAFMFTGQGSHYVGFGKELYHNHVLFRRSIDEFNGLARVHGFPSFLPLIDGSESDITKMSPVIVQLGLCSFEMALARLWASWGIKPSVVIGHSLGEYAALHVAGVLSASDTIYLVGARAQMLVDKCTAGTHAMLAVQGSVPSVVEALGGITDGVNVACINGPRESVLSGEANLVAEVAQRLTSSGFKCSQLRVPFAFHSPQVDPILDDFEKVAAGVRFNKAVLPVISPLLGKVVEGERINAAYLRNHARESVNILGGLVSAQTLGLIDEKTVWLEVGPHPVIAGMVKAAFGVSTVAVPTIRRNEPAYRTLSNSLCTLHSAGLNMNWNEFHRDFDSSVRMLDLPAYSFDEKNYWLQYTNDWCLSKNRLPVAPVTVAASEPVKPRLSTSSCQTVIREEVKNGVATVEIETNLSRDDIRLVVTGHKVNGAPLCPSTLYADMALTGCDYAYKLLRPDASRVGANVSHMEVPKTLIFDESLDKHVLRMTITADVERGQAHVSWSTAQGSKRTEHAFCTVYYGDIDAWQNEFDRIAYLIKGRIDHLKQAEREGNASKVGRGLAYKLFSALVDYDPRFRGMEEVILDSSTCEGTARIRFQTSPEDGNYMYSPFHIDSLCHISGFLINGTDAVDSREKVFISHAWNTLRFTEVPDRNKEYRSYIRMQPMNDGKIMGGDAYIFDGDRIIGVCGEIKFQPIPRKVLNMMLPPRGVSSAAPARAVVPAAKPSAAKAATPAPKTKKEKTITAENITKVNKKLHSVVSQVLDILAKEVGVSHDELADNIAFPDLGVDSLMALTVSGRIREELEIDLDSNVFVEHSTVGAFKKYLAQFETGDRTVPTFDSSATSDSECGTPDVEDSDVTTPPDESDVGSVKGDGESNEDLREIVRSTIATEMGMDVEEVIAAPDLSNLGMDSLMALSILGLLREKTGLDISSELFVTNASLTAVEKSLGIAAVPKKPTATIKPTTKAAAPVAAVPTSSGPVHPRIGVEEPAPPKAPRPAHIVDHYPHRKASSLLLAGNHRTATKQLFMIPDGSGNAASYTEIANVGGSWAVWGMFSPFMKTPGEYSCGVYGMAAKFIDEIKRRQPTGPYSLAGWSAGGIIAFEIVNQMIKAGDTVENLIFIDAPSPITIEPLPKGLHAWFASIGLLGDPKADVKIPPWLLDHFAASVTALSNYTAEAIPKEKCPKVMTIWCEDGVCHLPTDPRPEPYPKGHALFLLDNRSDFGPNQWDEYLDLKKMQFRHMPGNHFSMMHGDYAKKLAGFMREALQ